MALKNVELIRGFTANRMREFAIRLRNFISSASDNPDVVELLRGEDGLKIVAKLTEAVLVEIGHQTEVTAEDSNSRARRAAGATQRRVT